MPSATLHGTRKNRDRFSNLKGRAGGDCTRANGGHAPRSGGRNTAWRLVTNAAVLKAIAQAEQVARARRCCSVKPSATSSRRRSRFQLAATAMVRVNCAATEHVDGKRCREAAPDAIPGDRPIERLISDALPRIGELSAKDQVKPCVLQDRIHRLGGTQAIKVDVRINAATNCNLSRRSTGVPRGFTAQRLRSFSPALRERIRGYSDSV